MKVDGHNLEIHQQKKFLLNNPKKDEDDVNFAQFQLMYGDPDGNIEKDYENFMKFQMHRQN